MQVFFSKAHGELERVLQDTSRLLAQLTDCAAVVVSPAHEALVVRSALVARLSAHTAMAVAIFSNGVVEKRTISLPDDVSGRRAVLGEHRPCSSACRASSLWLVPPELPSGDAGRGRPRPCLRRAPSRTLRSTASTDQVFVGRGGLHGRALRRHRAGAGRARHPRAVLRRRDPAARRARPGAVGLDRLGAPAVESLAECSLVVAPYESEGVALGTIGVLGPTRMDYEHALAAVAVVGQRLSRELRGD